MIFIFPSDAVRRNAIEIDFAEQADRFLKNGHCVAVINESYNSIKWLGSPGKNKAAIYRGWMMTDVQYRCMYNAVSKEGISLITDPKQYLTCHYIKNWYEYLKDHTPRSVFFEKKQDVVEGLLPIWGRYFVKDYVKSLTTKRGSIADNIAEIHEIIDGLIEYRGAIEGGICIREFESLIFKSERRYFVYKRNLYPRGLTGLDDIQSSLRSIQSDFYSVDIANNLEGNYRIIEIGDGQVSDLKEWNTDEFAKIFSAE